MTGNQEAENVFGQSRMPSRLATVVYSRTEKGILSNKPLEPLPYPLNLRRHTDRIGVANDGLYTEQ